MSLCLQSLKHKLCNLWNINAKVKHIIRKHHITWRNIRDRDLNYEQEELGGINFKFIHITHVVIVCLQIARHKTDVLSCVPTSWSSVRLAYAIRNVFSYLNDTTLITKKLQIDYIDTLLKMYVPNVTRIFLFVSGW